MTWLSLFVCVASACGAAMLGAWKSGPPNRLRWWLKNRWRFGHDLLACEVCASFWAGLIAGVIGWSPTGSAVMVCAALIAPFVVERTGRSAAHQRGRPVAADGGKKPGKKCGGCDGDAKKKGGA